LVSQRKTVKHKRIFQKAKSGIEGTFDSSSMNINNTDDTNYIESIAIVPQTGWIIVVSQLRKEAYSTIQKLEVVIYIVGFLSFVLATFLASQILKRTLKPLHNLNQVTKRVAKSTV
jgi:sensor c-di-GMP phosphodiesterase-like protein